MPRVEKEKIIQVCGVANNSNPVLLTNKGRILMVIQQVAGDVSLLSSYQTAWADITPILERI